jgi:hypothetical protein
LPWSSSHSSHFSFGNGSKLDQFSGQPIKKYSTQTGLRAAPLGVAHRLTLLGRSSSHIGLRPFG